VRAGDPGPAEGGRPRVLVTRRLAGTALERLAPVAEVDLHEDEEPLSRERLLRRVAGAEALICLLSDSVDEEILRAGSRLKIVANYAVGVDNVDLAAARDRGVWVTNTPGVLTEATADLTFALILSLTRRLREGERLARSGAWKGWSPTLLLGRGLRGKRLGLVGFGRIGQAVARRAAAFGLEVVYHRRQRLPDSREERLRVRGTDLADLLATSDIVSLHLPLTAETRGLLDARAFAWMKTGALLINTARGEIVDQEALAEALSSGRLGGAGLDVFAGEPAIPEALRAQGDRVVLLPHLGSATEEARSAMAEMVVEDVLEALAGRRPERSLT
jgi:glyoxylate reductase